MQPGEKVFENAEDGQDAVARVTVHGRLGRGGVLARVVHDRLGAARTGSSAHLRVEGVGAQQGV